MATISGGIASRLAGFGLTLAASLGTFGFFALQGILLARMLGPEERGSFAAAVMFPQALLYLGLLGAPELFAGYASQNQANAAIRRSAALYGLTAGTISMLACIVLDWFVIPSEMRSVLPLAILCALTMPLQQIRLAIQAVDHGQRHFARYNQVRLIAAGMFPVLLAICWGLGIQDLRSACIIFFFSQFLSLGLAQLGMNDAWIGPIAVRVPTALNEARGLMGAWLSTELLERIDLVLIMVLIANETQLGFYAAAVPMAALMIIIPNAAGLYAFNRGARENELLHQSDVWKFVVLGLVVQAICGGVFAAILPYLVEFLYGPDFMPAVVFAWCLIPAGGFRGLLQAADSYLRARKKPAAGIKARLLALPVLIIGSYLTMPIWGAYAIPICLSVVQLLCFVMVTAAVLADTRESEPSLS